MDPITLIVTALAAGALASTKDTASSAVRDAYGALKALAKRRFAGRRDAELILERHEEAPEPWQAPLAAELSASGAEADTDLVAAAQALMNLVDEGGAQVGKYTVTVRGAQGVQIGDHNRQDNIFNSPPGG
jgi:RIP homotypic interaction motif